MYRTHRFAWRHLLRMAGTGQIAVKNSADVDQGEDPDTPIRRLLDGQDKRPWRTIGTLGERRIVVDASQIGVTVHTNRLIIPAGHNIYELGSAVKYQKSSTGSSWLDAELDPHGDLWLVPPPGGMLDVDYLAGGGNRVWHRVILLGGAVHQEMGELYLTRSFQPTTGEVPSWEHPPGESNATTSVMQGGDAFAVERGPKLRRFEVEHRAITGEDVDRFDAFFAEVGQTEPFWYDHSDTGDRYEVLAAFDDATKVTSSHATFATVPGGPTGGAANVVEATTTSAADDVLILHDGADAIGNQDWSDSLFSIDLYLPDAAIAVSEESFALRLYKGLSLADWALAKTLQVQQISGEWFRIFIDPGGASAAFFGAVDLGSVTKWELVYLPGAIGEVFRISNVLRWPKSKQAARVRLEGVPSRPQDHPVPGGPDGPSYTLKMRLLEVTT